MIQNLIAGKQAYIVPYQDWENTKQLAVWLKIPVMG
jgi:hypothetical protein